MLQKTKTRHRLCQISWEKHCFMAEGRAAPQAAHANPAPVRQAGGQTLHRWQVTGWRRPRRQERVWSVSHLNVSLFRGLCVFKWARNSVEPARTKRQGVGVSKVGGQRKWTLFLYYCSLQPLAMLAAKQQHCCVFTLDFRANLQDTFQFYFVKPNLVTSTSCMNQSLTCRCVSVICLTG